MGSVLRFPRGERVDVRATARATRETEIKFRYPGPDVVSEVSCSSEPRRKRVAARAPRVSRLA
jgi:hypothetical protein